MRKALGIFTLLIIALSGFVTIVALDVQDQINNCEATQIDLRLMIEAGEITTTTTAPGSPPTTMPSNLEELSTEQLLAINCEEFLVENLDLTIGMRSGSSAQAIRPEGENGQLPDSELVVVSRHGSYECKVARTQGAADMWLELVAAAQADGIDIEGGWCYRTYETQLRIWNERHCYLPGNCDGNPYPPTAFPGTSNHGWGTAVDVWNRWDVTLSCLDEEFLWMQRNAADFGWTHPLWAQCGQASQEPWHWEFTGIVRTIAEEIADNQDSHAE